MSEDIQYNGIMETKDTILNRNRNDNLLKEQTNKSNTIQNENKIIKLKNELDEEECKKLLYIK